MRKFQKHQRVMDDRNYRIIDVIRCNDVCCWCGVTPLANPDEWYCGWFTHYELGLYRIIEGDKTW